MNKRALYGIIIALIIPLGIFLFVNSLPKAVIPKPVFYDSVTTAVKNGKQIHDTLWSKISDAALTNQFGDKISLEKDILKADSNGKIIVANFFFTRCPKLCLDMTRHMKLLQNTVKKGVTIGDTTADYVQFVSFSIDPDRDSVPELKKWADRFQIDPANWWLLTADTSIVYRLSREMRLAVNDPSIDPEFPHTDIFALIDKNGVLRMRRDKFGNPQAYHSEDSTDLANLAQDIVLLSLEKDPKRKTFLSGKLPTIAVAMLITFLAVGIFLIIFRKKPTTK